MDVGEKRRELLGVAGMHPLPGEQVPPVGDRGSGRQVPPFTEVLDWTNPPFAKWFVGGTLNASYNCVDRHVEAGKLSLIHISEPTRPY